MARTLGVLVSTSLVAGSLVMAPMAAAGTATQPVDPAPLAAATPRNVKGSMSPAPPLVAQVQQFEPGRVGGRGLAEVAVMRRSPDGKALRNVTVTLRTDSKAGRVVAGAGNGWRCLARRGVVRCTKKSLPAGISPAGLLAKVRIRGKVPKRKVGLTAEVTWAHMGTFRTRAADGGKRTVSLVRDTESLEVYPRLRMSLRSPQGRKVSVMSDSGRTAREIFLSAKVKGVQGAKVTGRWRQLAGPKVRFKDPVKVSGVSDQLGQVAVTPKKLTGLKRMRFALTLRANGATVRRTVSLQVRGKQALGTLKPRYKQLRKLAKASKKRVPLVGMNQGSNQLITIEADPGTTVNPSRMVDLTVRPVRQIAAKVVSINWFSQQGKQITDLGVSGQNVQVAAPSQQDSSVVITVLVTLRSGRGIQSSIVINTNAPSRWGDYETPEQRTARLAKWCSIAETYKKIQDDPQSGATMQKYTLLEDKDSFVGDEEIEINARQAVLSGDIWNEKGICEGAGSITFGSTPKDDPGNVFQTYGGSGLLTDLKGTITSAGITITAGTWNMPSNIADKLRIRSWSPLDTLALQGSAVARFVGADLQPVNGHMEVMGNVTKAMTLLPLPDGWRANRPQVSFINSNPNLLDDPVRDGTVRYQTSGKDGNDGSAEFGVDIYKSKLGSVHVNAANIKLGTTAGGDTIQASGSGDFTAGELGKNAHVELGVACSKGTELTDNCEIFDHFEVDNFKLYWSESVMGLKGQAAVRYSDDRVYGFALAGSYTRDDEWEMAAQNTTPFPVVDNVVMDNILGKLQMKPASSDGQRDKAELVGAFTGTLKGLQFESGAEVEHVTGSLTNMCPEAANDKRCNEGDMRLAASAKVRIPLPGSASPVSLTADALVNLDSMEWVFTLGLHDVSIGPRELQITKATFTFSNGTKGLCGPKDVQLNEKSLHIGFVAEAKLFGATYTVGGGFSEKGHEGECLWGYPGPMDVGDGMQTSKNLMTYTSYKNGAQYDLPGFNNNQPMIIGKRNVMTLHGTFEMSKEVSDFFSIPKGGLAYRAELAADVSSASFEIEYQVAEGQKVYLYKTPDANLGLTHVGFSVDYLKRGTSTSTTLRAYSRGSLFIRGNQAQNMPDSETPLGVSLGFSTGTDGVSIDIQGGAETAQGPVRNAFGQPGLTVNDLAFKASLAMPLTSSSVALNADAQLPAAWTAGADMPTTAKLVTRLGQNDNCLQFELGSEAATLNDPPVLDIGSGRITASYVKLLVAPTGCWVPVGSKGTKRLDPGYGLAFVGRVLGSPIDIVINVGFQGGGLQLAGHVKTEKFDLYALTLSSYDGKNGPDLTLDIDTTQAKYDMDLDASVEVGSVKNSMGGLVRVQGRVRTSGEAYEIRLVGNGAVELGPVNVRINELDVDVLWYKDPAKSSKSHARAIADISAGAFGLSIGARGELVYASDNLLKLDVSVDTKIDILVASVDGRIAFNYCLGELTVNSNKRMSDCALFPHPDGASPAYRLSLIGKYSLLWSESDYRWIAYDQPGKDGNIPGPPPPPTPVEPGYVPGPTPSTTAHTLSVEVLQKYHDVVGDDGTLYKSTRPTKTMSIIDGTLQSVPACDSIRLGTDWNPTNEDPNPPIEPVDPSKQTCGLRVNALSPGSSTVRDSLLACNQNACFDVYGKQLLGGGARTELLAGLRSPVGVVPAGAQITGPVVSPDGKYVLSSGANGFHLRQKSTDKDIWSAVNSSGFDMTIRRVNPKGELNAYAWVQGRKVSISAGIPFTSSDVKDEPYMFVQDGLAVYTGADKQSIWAVNALGNCLPDKDSCQVREDY